MTVFTLEEDKREREGREARRVGVEFQMQTDLEETVR
jgi:hypothetical protein